MKTIVISDTTLCRESGGFSFKEKIEIARQLDKLNVNVIELPAVQNVRTDVLLVRTLSSFVKKSVLSVAAGADVESIENAVAALSGAARPRIRIELSTSPVGMEYTYHKKPAKMLAWISEAVAKAKQSYADVEFCALDATRAESEFLSQAIAAAVAAGATTVSVSDDACRLLPDDFAAFAADVASTAGVPVSVRCNNRNGMACAAALLATRREGVSGVKTSVGGDCVPLEIFAETVRGCGADYGFATDVKCTELHRVVGQINWVADRAPNGKALSAEASKGETELYLDAKDSKEDVTVAVCKLGYDLSEEDSARVYEEFLRVAEKKKVGARDLEAIVASVALQVPATYQLESYIINNGNIIPSSAQITLTKEGKEMRGISIGDGPVNAAFLAIEQIIGRRYELDDFQIQSVTEGAEAMGSALVKLRYNGKLYSGKGISTDIIGASIRAYINAVNKIVYEEDAQ